MIHRKYGIHDITGLKYRKYRYYKVYILVQETDNLSLFFRLRMKKKQRRSIEAAIICGEEMGKHGPKWEGEKIVL